MQEGKQDRRVQKTQFALHQALIGLMREKKYDSILVQEILDRANVGRSTFYMHFRDKDELLVGGIDHLSEFLQQAQLEVKRTVKKPYESVIGFSTAMFEHADQHRDVYLSLLGGAGWVMISRTMQEMSMQLIKKEAKPLYKLTRSPELPFELFVHFIATTFWSVLEWWISQRKTISPKEIDSYFRGLVMPVLAERLGNL